MLKFVMFFFFLLLVLTSARAQQVFNTLKIKELELPSESSSKVLYLDSSKKVKSSGVTDTELGYLSGATSNLQSQITTNTTNISSNASAIATKEPAITSGTTSQYWRGDKSWQTLDKSAVGLGNVVNADTTNPANITQNSTYRFTTDAEKATWNAKENAITSGTTSQYFRGDKTFQTLDKAAVGLSNVDNTSDATKNAATATLTNKTLTSPVINNGTVSGASIQSPSRLDPKKDTKANLTTYAATATNGEMVYATDTKEFFVVKDGALNQVGSGAGGSRLNLLIDGSFEQGVTTDSGTCSSCTATSETTNILATTTNTKALKVSFSAASGGFSIDKTTGSYFNGSQGVVGCWISTTQSGVQFVARSAATDSTSLIKNVTNDGVPRYYEIPVVLGSASVGFKIKASSTITGDIYADECYAGPATVKVDTNNISTWQSFTPTGTWNTNVTYSGKWRRVGDTAEVTFKATLSGAPNAVSLAFNFPTSVIGQVDTTKITSTDIGNISLGGNVLDSGVERLGIDGLYVISGSTVNPYYYRAASGTNPVRTTLVDVSNVAPITFGAGDSVEVTIAVPIVGWASSGSIYSSTNADTDWQTCTFASTSWQGLGTVDYSNLKCKRQGGDLKIYGKVVTGTASASSLQIPLPVWNGSQLTSKSTIPSSTMAGRITRSNASVNNTKDYSLIIGPSITYMNMSYNEFTTATNPLSAATGSSLFGNNETIVFEHVTIPIEGWENSNITIGQFADYFTKSEASAISVFAYFTNSSGNFVNSDTVANRLQNFNEQYDTASAFNPTTGYFVAPINGYYHYDLSALTSTVAWTASQNNYCRVKKNDVIYKYGGVMSLPSATMAAGIGPCSGTIYLAKNDTLSFLLWSDRGTTAINTDGTFNHLYIDRVGIPYP